MTAFDIFRTMLQLIGLAAIVMACGLAWAAWTDKRSRRRYLDAERDRRGGT